MQVTQGIEPTRQARRAMGRVGFVPTMGALHKGHVSLIDRARELADHVVVSIFVNPTQFGPKEDLAAYPRPFENDLRLCREAGVDLVFAPTVDDIYPPGEAPVTIDVLALTADLEGAYRPGHFAGVCRIVAKLFCIVTPDVACFGEKDYQQLRVIEAMTAGLCLPIAIERCPTIRESDGLACSSRNVYLDAEQRGRAVGLYEALREARGMIHRGEGDPGVVEAAMRDRLTHRGMTIDYAVARDAHTLQPIERIDLAAGPVVCLIAARLGRVRLIDNMVIDAV